MNSIRAHISFHTLENELCVLCYAVVVLYCNYFSVFDFLSSPAAATGDSLTELQHRPESPTPSMFTAPLSMTNLSLCVYSYIAQRGVTVLVSGSEHIFCQHTHIAIPKGS